MNNKPFNQDINYLQGQIHAQQALLLAVAGLTMTQQDFREQGMKRLQNIRDVLLQMPVADATIQGLEDTARWLESETR